MTNSDKMALWPMKKLVFSMSIPAVFSMVIQALYNIVDTIYVSQISQDALFVMGLVFPLQMVALAIALGGGIGTSTLIARRLGEKRKEEANKVATTGFILAFFHTIFVMCVGLFFSSDFLSLFTNDPVIINMGYDYLSIVLGLSFGVFGSVFFEKIQQAQGNMILPMIAMIIGAVVNIILDPILIFGYFNLPVLGIKGAAIATIIGQFCGFIFIMCTSVFGKHDVKIEFKNFSFEKTRVLGIYKIGLPVAVMNMVASFATTALNSILVSISAVGVTALSVYFKLQSFIFMPVFGFNQGTLPILSYNFGSKNYTRFKQAITIYVSSGLAIMCTGTIMMWLFTNQLLGLFNADASLIAIGNSTLKLISLSFPFAALSIVVITILQSVGKGFSSLTVSLLRQIIFLLPLSFILSKFYSMNGIWMSFPIAEILVLLLYGPRAISIVKKEFQVK